jgi:hypothetical protein
MLAVALMAVALQASASDPAQAASRRAAAACQAKGGSLHPVCRMATPICVVRYRDAGKACTDNSQCLGECVTSSTTRRPFWPWDKPAVGVCSPDNDPCGCKTEIIGGKPQDYICGVTVSGPNVRNGSASPF